MYKSEFIQLGVRWASWVCRLFFYSNLEGFFAIISSDISYSPNSLPFLLFWTPLMHILVWWCCPTILWCSLHFLFILFFFLSFRLDNLNLPIIKCVESFLPTCSNMLFTIPSNTCPPPPSYCTSQLQQSCLVIFWNNSYLSIDILCLLSYLVILFLNSLDLVYCS